MAVKPFSNPEACVQVSGVYMMMGRGLERLQQAQAGNIVAIGGLEHAILKSATLASTSAATPIAPMLFQASLIREAQSWIPSSTASLGCQFSPPQEGELQCCISASFPPTTPCLWIYLRLVYQPVCASFTLIPFHHLMVQIQWLVTYRNS